MTFHPKINQGEFTCFWSTDKAWGKAFIQAGSMKLEVLFGELDLARITLPVIFGYRDVEEISNGEDTIIAANDLIHIYLSGSMPLQGGTSLSMKFRK